MNDDRSRNGRVGELSEGDGARERWYDRLLTRIGLKSKDTIRHDLEEALAEVGEEQAQGQVLPGTPGDRKGGLHGLTRQRVGVAKGHPTLSLDGKLDRGHGLRPSRRPPAAEAAAAASAS